MRPPDLSGSVALVTGAAAGIGAATARALHGTGAQVMLVDLDPAVAAVASALGPNALACVADVTDQRSLDAAVSRTTEAFGRLDVVVANAGITSHGTIRTSSSDTFARVVDVNLVGVHRTVSAALPHLERSRGYVLVVASLASFVPLPGGGGYSPSKAGVDSLAAMLRVELATTGVAVGTVHPSWIDTAMVRRAEEELPTFRRLRQQLPWPTRATTTPEACAQAIVGAVARRARRVYVPRSAAVIGIARGLITSPLGERAAIRKAGRLMPQLDAEVLMARQRLEAPVPAEPQRGGGAA